MIAPRITSVPFEFLLLTVVVSACASAPMEPPRYWVEPVALGDRVRVWAPSVGVEGLVGTLAALRPDTIVIDNDRHGHKTRRKSRYGEQGSYRRDSRAYRRRYRRRRHLHCVTLLNGLGVGRK